MIKRIIVFSLFLFFIFSIPALADETSDLSQKITEYTQKLTQLGTAKNTLANQIKIIDSQVQLTLLKITQTENSIKTLESEINQLGVEIEKLDGQLDTLSVIFINQIVQNYKLQKRVPEFAYIFSSNLNDFLEQHKYITILQKDSQNNLINMETVRTNYDLQKTTKEKKQTELEELKKTLADQKISLNNQKNIKNQLLESTKNDEKKYQKLLDDARSELAAISSILAGNGTETKVGNISEGEIIASVISGSSCSSSGTHLHFMVTKNNEVQNPFNYLKSTDYTNNSGGDSFNPSGSWNWPLSPKISFNQGYGKTWSISHTWVGKVYSFHNGIDIAGSSTNVTSPISGTLYRGSFYIKSGGCYLRYVKVIGENGIGTLNLHVNYIK